MFDSGELMVDRGEGRARGSDTGQSPHPPRSEAGLAGHVDSQAPACSALAGSQLRRTPFAVSPNSSSLPQVGEGLAGARGGQAEMMGTLAVMASETEQARQATGGAVVSEIAAGWLAPQYLVALHKQLSGLADGPERFTLLRKVAGEVVALQLAGIWSGRLRVEQEKLEFLRQKHREEMEAAAKLAEVNAAKKRDLNQPMTEEELKACVDKVDEIFGIKKAKPILTTGR